MSETDNALLVEKRGAVGVLTLNRPDQINALTDAIRLGIPAALKDFEEDSAIRVVLIQGAGPRGFCAGADIKESRGAETVVQARKRMARTSYNEVIASFSKPVIAAVHGICFGGGFEVALACDIRIASSDAVFSLPEISLGLLPGGGGTQRLARTIGLGPALDLMLTGDRIDAQEAKRLGIITRLVEKRDDLEAAAMELAEKIAAKPPTAAAYIKEAARNGLELDLKAGLVLERTLFNLLLTTEDRVEAATAFREKRKPAFTGR